MIRTEICEILGIKYPVIQGGMAWVANAELAAAVSNGGGLGLIAGGAAPAEVIEKEIETARMLTDKPFGVNIMLLSPNADDLAQMVIDKRVKVVTTGAGMPSKYIGKWKEAGIRVIPVVPSANIAKRMERLGADAVIAEGTESGGHIGEITTMALIPQVCDAVGVPVIAAGGIGDGRGFAAALMLGAKGVQIGTLFLSAQECCIHRNYKELLFKAKDTDTVVTGREGGHPVRSLKCRFTKRLEELVKSNASLEEVEAAMAGSLRKAVQEGNLDEGTFMAGQIAGMIKEERPAKEILDTLMEQAAVLLVNFRELRGVTIG